MQTTEGEIIRKEKHLEEDDAAGDSSETLYKIDVPANRYSDKDAIFWIMCCFL